MGDENRTDQIVHVVAAALVDDLTAPTRVLAARRTKPTHLAGQWEFPGGKVDPGETPEQALHRELGEELGIRVHLGAVLPGPLADDEWELAHPYRMKVWFAVVESGTPQTLQDHDDLRVLGADDLHSVPWLDTNAVIVDALATHLH